MGFSEGTEDEFLLTCFVCKQPFGMLAAFCGGCGARRDQAMGVERAKSSQQITQNVLETPSFEEVAPNAFGNSELDTYLASTNLTSDLTEAEPVKKVKKQRKQSIRRQIFVSNMRLRIEAMSNWQSRHAIVLNLSGFVLFLGAAFLFIQSFITGTSHPEAVAEKFLTAAVQRDASYFDINNEVENGKTYPVFPVKFTKANEATDWVYSSTIKGVSGSAEVSIFPSDGKFDQTPITLTLKAKSHRVLGIIKTIDWVPALPTATIEVKYPNSSNTLVYINGYIAGSLDNPAIKPGKYSIFPGELEFKFYKNGEETDGGFTYFIQTSGTY